MQKTYLDFEKKYVLENGSLSPAAKNLFATDEKSPKLDDKMREDFHMYTARGLFAYKRALPNTATAISVLSNKVRSPSVDD